MFNRFKKQVQDDQGKIKLGTRVIRGPDWNHKCEDNGEGFLGTIVAFDVDKRLIEVIWDSGRRGHYRADLEKYDLRMFDNAPTGELHHGTVCHNCSDRPIHGMKWTCKKCNIDMCTPCYMNDKHNEAHGFERTDSLESTRYKVRPRNSFKERVVIKGIFVGAEVVAGPNSKHDFESDGGDVGYVEEVTSWQNKYHRGIVSVFWKASNRTQFYRLGAEGCVDVFCSRLTETASGGTCYVDNLPVVDINRMSTETPDLVPRTSDGYFAWQLKYQHETVTSSKDSQIHMELFELELLGELNEGNKILEGTETYSHFESTVMLVGEPGSGKTCIARYLIGKQPTRFNISTEGIEIYNGLAYMDREKKEWVEGKQATVNKKASIIIWEFGGKDVFYSTHLMFLTYRAIYIIVLDGSRKLDDPCPYEQFLQGKSGHKTSRDYLRFWIITIVKYCKGSIQGFPKILVVLTHKDRVPANEVETRRRYLFGDIYQMFDTTQLLQHLVIDDEIFVNGNDKHDPEKAKIKSAIIRESERQPTWGEPVPKCFIPLELEFASMKRRQIPIITLEHLKKINSLQPNRPLSEAELKAFLKFQHSIGKLLYFVGHKLDDRIILSPTLLIDAFKSIVTDRQFCKGDKNREDMWDVMSKNGFVTKRAIERVWKRKKYVQFYKDKEYLLNVMTHLDILVQPMRYNSNRMRIPADFYYVASMVRAEDNSGYLQTPGITKRNIAIAFLSSSMMIPPAISFRFISYCIYVWAVKTYGDTIKDMLFHRSGVFTIDPSLDIYVTCEDEMIIARLVHATSNTLIMRDVASSICECLTSALEKISQLYIKTSSDQTQASDASFMTRICCNSPDNPCLLPNNDLANTDQNWICPTHSIEHSIYTITSWIAGKDQEQCKPGCSVTNEVFLRAIPSDLHLRRLSLMYRSFAAKDLAIHLGFSNRRVETIMEIEDPMIANFEILRQCRDSRMVTFKDTKEALERIGKESIHILCKLVKGQPIDFDMEPEKWDLVPTAEHIDRLAPLVGKNSLSFLIELEMDFHSWEQISHRQNEKDLVRLNKDILEEWRLKFCRMHNLKPTLREIARAFSNVGKNVKIVDNTLSDLFY